MTAGLPGTGIGALFYFLLVLFMPVREFVILLKGRSSWHRWRLVGRQWAMLATMLVTMWGWAWLVNHFCLLCIQGYARLTGQSVQAVTAAISLRKTGAMFHASVVGALISLTFVIGLVFVLRTVVRWQKRTAAIQSASKPVAGLQPSLAASALRERVSLQPAK